MKRCCANLKKRKFLILLGTQMVAKGLDFENVTLVGVLDADLSLYAQNYHAAERTYSLLAQVVGRAGRGERPGRAVIQTYHPENEVIQAAAKQDYETFYQNELRMRFAAALSAVCRSVHADGLRP
ncbi:MAG: helicase-related protein [Oscillibacter sp.]